MKNKKFGFTLIELLVVIAIIGVLSTMAIIALSNARAKARDSKRVADIKQISTALELYYSDYNYYPTIITPGSSLTSPDGTKVYMAAIPNNPTPRNDSGCGDNNYTYASTSDNTNYSLNFCLGNPVSSTPSGINSASSSGMGTVPGLIGWWKMDEGTGTTTADSSGNGNIGTLTNGPVWQDPANCKVGSCLSFDGINDYVNATGNVNALNTQSAITVSYWAKLRSCNGPGGGPHPGIVGRSGIFIERISEGCSSSTHYFYGDVSMRALNGSVATLNSWYFFVHTYDKSGPIQRLYINSNLVGTDTGNVGNLYTAANPLLIGISYASSYADALIDDVRLYNRALSATEVLALYNATK
ncbi:MAG: prepilin-type N-terminal cleavage/methylation domain-containing protein [Candidatus Falkowbacteria bacterium]|nr:prepilin-type N-terminal cleavage/methylation domain-containing protein [Candidatus Falkowbacteria bacterium]